MSRRRRPRSTRSSTTCWPRTIPARPTPSRSAARSTTGDWRGCTSPKASAVSGLEARLQRHVDTRLREAGAPPQQSMLFFNLFLAAPTMVTHGSDELRKRALRPMFTGEDVWCQLFSEPGSGSDLAGLSTRAVRDGDEWVVNGQKVWNTLAHLADKGMLVARTDPELPEAQGPHLLHGRHARAGRRGATAAPDHRRGRVQRGVPHRRAHSRRRPHRRHRRRLARLDDDADERAHDDRRAAAAAARSAAAGRSPKRSTRGSTSTTTPPLDATGS